MRELKTGIGFRPELAKWLSERPASISCLELTAENFYETNPQSLRHLAKTYPLLVHGLGLSLGTPGPLVTDNVRRFREVAFAAQALWVSEHIAFTRSLAVDLGHLNPVFPTKESIAILSEHAREVSATCERPLLLENIASFWRPRGDDEPLFLNELCLASGCELLLDVTNLFVNSRNHRFCPYRWLEKLAKSNVRQLHVVGYSYDGGRWHDRHAEPIQEDLWELIAHTLKVTAPEAVIIERDSGPLDIAQLEGELVRLAELNG